MHRNDHQTWFFSIKSLLQQKCGRSLRIQLKRNYWNMWLFMAYFRRVQVLWKPHNKVPQGTHELFLMLAISIFFPHREHIVHHWKCRTECFCQHYSYPKLSGRKLLEFLLEINCITRAEGQYHFLTMLKTKRIAFCTTPQLKCITKAAEGNHEWNVYHRVNIQTWLFWILWSNLSK